MSCLSCSPCRFSRFLPPFCQKRLLLDDFPKHIPGDSVLLHHGCILSSFEAEFLKYTVSLFIVQPASAPAFLWLHVVAFYRKGLAADDSPDGGLPPSAALRKFPSGDAAFFVFAANRFGILEANLCFAAASVSCMGEEPEVFEPVVFYVSVDVVHFEVVEDGNS